MLHSVKHMATVHLIFLLKMYKHISFTLKNTQWEKYTIYLENVFF